MSSQRASSASPANGHDPGARPGGVYISQVARMLGVSPWVLRAWENEGLITPARTASGYRVFAPEDLDRLRRIRDLVGEGLNPAGVRRVLDAEAGPDDERGRPPRAAVHDRVLALRKTKGISLRQLAAAAGMSASSVSAIERGLSAPSVATLQRLAAALDTNVSGLLDTPRPQRSARRAPARAAGPRHGDARRRVREPLRTDTVLQSILVSVEPDHGSQESCSHEGEELIDVIEGQFEVTLDELYTYRLGPKDAMTFDSIRPHRWHNPGTVRTVTDWVNTPPTF